MHRHTERPLYIPLSEPASLPELTQEYGWRTYWGKYRIMKGIKRIWQNFFHGTGRNHNKSVPNWYNLMLLVPTRRQIWTNRAESRLIFSILQYVLYRMLTILGYSQFKIFVGQIAGISLCLLQYNILSYVNCCESNETIGGQFAKISKNSVELSVAEKNKRHC